MFKKQNRLQPTLARRPSALDQGNTYSLIVTNNSLAADGWDFFVYQQDPGQPNPSVFSLAWFSKTAAPTTQVQFNWQISYDFVWSQTGVLVPGVTFDASQTWPADLISANEVTLSQAQGTLGFSDQDANGAQGSLTIKQDGSVLPNVAAVGIGMSGQGTFVTQAEPNIEAIFTPEPTYWIAFGQQVKAGVVLETQVGNNAQVQFPPNVYTMYATLDSQNLWTVSPTPPSPNAEGGQPTTATLPVGGRHKWPARTYTHLSVDWAHRQNPGSGTVSVRQGNSASSLPLPVSIDLSGAEGSIANNTDRTITYTLS